MTKPLRRWTGPSGQEYEVWRVPDGVLWCKECVQSNIAQYKPVDCLAAPACTSAILRLPGDPPSWAKEQK